jgi:T5orf172 domain
MFKCIKSIYAIGSDTEGSLIKIGFTTRGAAYRLKEIPGVELKVLHERTHETPNRVEKVVHQILREHRVYDEWFKVSLGEVILAIAKAVSIVDRGDAEPLWVRKARLHLHLTAAA